MTQNRFNVIANSYERALQQFPDARTDAQPVMRLLGVNEDDTLLEIACGTGFLTVQLLARLGRGQLHAYDIAPEMIRFAQQKTKNDSRIQFHCSSDLSEIEDGTIDKAVCFGGFHHIEHPVYLFREIRRVLKPGGVFVVGDFADDSPVQRYFDERIHRLTSTGHSGLFLSYSQMENFARFSGLCRDVLVSTKVCFRFGSEEDIGLFFQLVHALNQDPAETLVDVKNYMGIKRTGDVYCVPMDYIYARYRKL